MDPTFFYEGRIRIQMTNLSDPISKKGSYSDGSLHNTEKENLRITIFLVLTMNNMYVKKVAA